MFSSFLDPTIEGYVTVSENDGIWTMTEGGNDLLTLTEVDNNLSSLSGNDTNDNSFLSLSDSSVSNQLSSNKIIEVLKPNQSITANFITNDAGDLILDMDSSPPVNVTESFGFCEGEGEGSGSYPSVEKIAQENNTQLGKDQPPSTCHTNPNWLNDLKRVLKSDIMENCSKKVRDAVNSNEKIDDVKERREVRNMILNFLVDRIVEIFGGVSRPGIDKVREIVVELKFIYPSMFKDDEESTGYGFGGTKGGRALANHILDRVRVKDGMSLSTKKRDGEDNNPAQQAAKKGKVKLIYGKSKVSFWLLNV